MNYRSREDFAASKYLNCQPAGSSRFCNPSEVENWNQSVPIGEVCPLTPSDSDSDSAPSDCQDMNAKAWTRPSVPEQDSPWYMPMQRTTSGWSPITTQGEDYSQAAAWLGTSNGSVDSGLSPVLSYDSQSSHTLNTISEPDPYMLPPQWDLSCSTQPVWDQPGTSMYSNLDSGCHPSPQFGPAFGFPSVDGYYQETRMLAPGPGGNQSPAQREAGPIGSTSVIPMRPIRPRTGDSHASGHQTASQKGVSRPDMQGSLVTRPSMASVSNANNHGFPSSPAIAPYYHGHDARYRNPGMSQDLQTFRSGVSHHDYQNGMAHLAPDSSAEDFSAFIQFDPEEQPVSPMTTRFDPNATINRKRGMDLQFSGGVPRPVMPAIAPKDNSQGISRPEEDLKQVRKGASSVTSLASEGDEGRHRGHPLYKHGPHADGLYYCPFKDKDPSCPHKPTKLKCNYDKFVDSHIKPFRCKIEACSKQEFSSTACLLRHEREAHGMHGHGDRPHLCIYPGCERGMSGNGFPRRYNLFDHMRRMHDHKEEAGSTSTTSPDAPAEKTRFPVNRKRKSTGQVTKPSIARRQKFVGPSGKPSQVLPQSSYAQLRAGFVAQTPMHELQATHARMERELYASWESQQGLQMNLARNSQDGTSMQGLGRHYQDCRPVRQEVRRV